MYRVLIANERSVFHTATVRLVGSVGDFFAGEHGIECVGEQFVGCSNVLGLGGCGRVDRAGVSEVAVFADDHHVWSDFRIVGFADFTIGIDEKFGGFTALSSGFFDKFLSGEMTLFAFGR